MRHFLGRALPVQFLACRVRPAAPEARLITPCGASLKLSPSDGCTASRAVPLTSVAAWTDPGQAGAANAGIQTVGGLDWHRLSTAGAIEAMMRTGSPRGGPTLRSRGVRQDFLPLNRHLSRPDSTLSRAFLRVKASAGAARLERPRGLWTLPGLTRLWTGCARRTSRSENSEAEFPAVP